MSHPLLLTVSVLIALQLGTRLQAQGVASPTIPPEIAGDDAVVAVIPLGRQPGIGLAADPWAIWIPNNGEATVTRLDPVTNRIVATIPTGGAPANGWDGRDPLAVASNGREVWVTMTAEKAVARIDPASDTVVETLPLGVLPYSLTLTDSDLWVVASEANTLIRIDLASRREAAYWYVPFPAHVAIHGDSAWVTALRAGELWRIDVATNEIASRLSLGMVSHNVAVTDGQIWVTHPTAGRVSRIDPARNEVVAVVELTGNPFGIAIDEQGVWVAGTAHGEHANTLSLIDPDSNRLTWVLPVPDWVQNVVAAHGAVWINSPRDGDAHGYLYRVERRP